MDDSDDELAILVVEDEGGNEVLTKPINYACNSFNIIVLRNYK